MQLGVGRASRKSGVEHISIFQKTFLPSCGCLIPLDQVSVERNPLVLRPGRKIMDLNSWTNADSLSSSKRGLSLNEGKAL